VGLLEEGIDEAQRSVGSTMFKFRRGPSEWDARDSWGEINAQLF